MRVLIADDHKLLRDTLTTYLAQQPDLEIVAASDIEEALSIIAAQDKFDLALLDYDMPGMNALRGLQAVFAAPNAPPVALISGVASHHVVRQAFQMGARGFLHKTMPAASLLHALRFMAVGERYVPVDFLVDSPLPYLPQPDQADLDGSSLTPRETEVLRALCFGMTNKEIARDLDLTEATVKLHLKTLCRRLGASNRTQAAMMARTRGFC